ncbi:PH domain-containing protein [Hymenobacter aerilatus]|uniref:PH domain-containing protein n=1 Tax=Hymenobacter aerilatus TaxID=2932251 RepID=A0A8T9T2M7_9BACT|nr:PH domain-containing protein [Hymenobacter aerilatus]UOR06366.1 PH domain-containing protein [Hymenobacter aerilatus]
MNQVFPSKISWWLFGPILLLLLVLPFGYWQKTTGHFVATLVNLSVVAFFLYLMRTTYYTLTPTHLLVRCGPWRVQMPVASITRVEPTHNPISSAALSLDRLAIHYNRYDEILLSPRDKAGFVEALRQLNPQIQVG